MKAVEYIRAVEYVKVFLDSEDPDPEVDLGMVVVEDFIHLLSVRKPHSNAAHISIIKEVMQRLKKAREIEPKIPEWIIQIAIKSHWPKIYEFCVKDKIFLPLESFDLVGSFFRKGEQCPKST